MYRYAIRIIWTARRQVPPTAGGSTLLEPTGDRLPLATDALVRRHLSGFPDMRQCARRAPILTVVLQRSAEIERRRGAVMKYKRGMMIVQSTVRSVDEK